MIIKAAITLGVLFTLLSPDQARLGALPARAPANNSPLSVDAMLVIPRAVGYFDYMVIDQKLRRLIVAHTESQAVAFVDVDRKVLQREVYIGAAPHGISIDERAGVYFVGTSGAQHAVVMIDRSTLKVTGSIPLPGPVDALALDTVRHTLYADADDGDSIWVIDVVTKHILATIHTPRDSDKVEYDRQTDRIYQNFTTTNSLLVIDPQTQAILASWSTLPATRPHGLAIDDEHHRLFTAGVNGKLAVIDMVSGRVISTVDVARRVDQIAFDAKRGRLYCASGEGMLSVVAVTSTRVRLLANVGVPRGAHTVAVDSSSGAVWLSYGTQRDDYVLRLSPR